MDYKICELCTGCRCCQMICPKNAISMVEDNEGFLVPQIDKSKCIDCGLCKKNCPQNKEIDNNNIYYGEAYAAQIKDDNILFESTSGGFFSAIAIEIIKRGGVVFGATIDDDLYVKHISVCNEEDLKKIRGSKYVASDIQETYAEVKEYLENGVEVLYSGCPCQIAGLKSYLNKKYEKLITVDIICHGTPSWRLFKVYIEGMKKKIKSNITNYKFRDKAKYGWGVYWSFLCKKGVKRGGMLDNPYEAVFIKGVANKEACYKCKYVGFNNRPADITLGDYWGIDIIHPEFASNKGVSAVIINNKKEYIIDLMDEVLDKCKYLSTEKESIAKYNSSLIKNVKRPQERNTIYKGINSKQPIDFLSENLKVSKMDFIKTKIRLLIPYNIRIKLKKLLN